MKLKTSALTGLTLLCGWTAARAQMTGATQESDSAQQRQQLQAASLLMTVSTNDAAPEFYPGETSDVGPQSLVQHPRQPLVHASLDEQYFYSDNVFRSTEHRQDADVLVSTLDFAITPKPAALAGGSLAPRLGYQHQWFTYGLAGHESLSVIDYHHLSKQFYNAGIDLFNFNSATPFADLTWTRGDWIVTLGEDLRWLMDSSSYDSFYREFVTRWSAGRSFHLAPGASVYLGYEGDYRFTDSQFPPAVPDFAFPPHLYNEEFNDRTDQGVMLVGSFRLCDHAVLQPYEDFTYSGYTEIKRHDYLNTFGVALICQFTPNIALRTFVNYDIMHTDGYYVQSYKQFGGGLGLNLSVQF